MGEKVKNGGSAFPKDRLETSTREHKTPTREGNRKEDKIRQDLLEHRPEKETGKKTRQDKTRQDLLEANIHRPKYLKDADHLAV
jgi:hypothetical protein